MKDLVDLLKELEPYIEGKVLLKGEGIYKFVIRSYEDCLKIFCSRWGERFEWEVFIDSLLGKRYSLDIVRNKEMQQTTIWITRNGKELGEVVYSAEGGNIKIEKVKGNEEEIYNVLENILHIYRRIESRDDKIMEKIAEKSRDLFRHLYAAYVEKTLGKSKG